MAYKDRRYEGLSESQLQDKEMQAIRSGRWQDSDRAAHERSARDAEHTSSGKPSRTERLRAERADRRNR